MRRSRIHRRRAALYVVVLVAALVVAVIGLSALTVARIEARGAKGTHDASVARFYAQSAIELGLYSLTAYAGWRSAYTNDTWVPEQSIGEGQYTWKLVDEQDGDLTNDATQPVRLYGQGRMGDAVRICSVLVQTSAGSVSRNLLENAGMEQGTSNWSCRSYCDLESHTDNPHGGKRYIWVKDRAYVWAGPSQEVTADIEKGATYEFSVWVKLESGSDIVELVIEIDDSASGENWSDVGSMAVGTEWANVTGTCTPTWDGTLEEARIGVATRFGTIGFKIDDAVFQKLDSSSPIRPVPGTWRREVLP